jgi:hypothetical protein
MAKNKKPKPKPPTPGGANAHDLQRTPSGRIALANGGKSKPGKR